MAELSTMSTMEISSQPLVTQKIFGWRSLYYADKNFSVGLIIALAFVFACSAITLHVPGQISMDTSIQLYEASTGQATSFNPPFMSALMRWVGGGEVATSIIVLINAIFLYGGLALIAITAVRLNTSNDLAKIATWRLIVACAILANPIVFIYVGIVWKDILFASFLTFGCALGVAACYGSFFRRILLIFLSVFILACAYQTRQQGVFMAPALLLTPIASAWFFSSTKKTISALAITILFAGSVFFIQSETRSAINSLDGKFDSVGYNSIMKFDLAGIVSNSDMPSTFFVYPISSEQLAAVRSVYDSSRIDYLERSKTTLDWLELPQSKLRHAWFQMIKQNPEAYVLHRTSAFSALLGLHGVAGTLPIHVGVAGNPSYLAAVGIPIGTNKRSQLLFDIATSFYEWPIYKHIYWMAALFGIVCLAVKLILPKPLKLIGFSIVIASVLMYASFAPTTIASDFRYLFATIPLIMSLMLITILSANWRVRAKKVIMVID